MRLFVLVTGFLVSCVAAQKLGTKIETSRGTCECVMYTDCDAANTVDTTIFKISTRIQSRSRTRGRRQIEERPEQCNDQYVCCLVNKVPDTNNGEGSNNGGSTDSSPTDVEPCRCLLQSQCDQNITDTLLYGTGEIVKKAHECGKDLVHCCDRWPVDGSSPGTPIESPPSSGPQPPRPENPETPDPETPEPPAPLCGIPAMNFDSVINKKVSAAGDGSTMFGEHPWTLMILKKENVPFECGASLVQPAVAITAAHCVEGSQPFDLRVRAGEWDTLNNTTLETLPHQEQRVKQIIVHPEFNSRTLHNDIAILHLENPFELTDNVGLICLPTESSPDPYFCTATGWGKDAFNEDSPYSHVMKQVILPYVPHKDCESKFQKTRLKKWFVLGKSFICAGGVSKEDTCKGDGGGPLGCLFPDDSRYYLLGITSWGLKEGCGKEDIPGAYTNVRSFANWIASNIESPP